MDILKPILDIYDEKKDVLTFYLDASIKDKIVDLDYLDDGHELFLNDRILFVQKNTGKIYQQGIIIKITKKRITIKTRNTNFSLPIADHYLFLNPRRNKLQNNNRKFYQELLKSLQ